MKTNKIFSDNISTEESLYDRALFKDRWGDKNYRDMVNIELTLEKILSYLEEIHSYIFTLNKPTKESPLAELVKKSTIYIAGEIKKAQNHIKKQPSKITKKNICPLLSKKEDEIEIRRKIILDLYDKGLKPKDIAEKVGLHVSNVNRYLQKMRG